MPPGDTTIVNTIVYGTVDGIGGSPDVTYQKPTLSYTMMEAFDATYQAQWTGTNVIFGWPNFIDAANQDYHLSSISAAIDFGNNDAVLTPFDLDYNDRIQDWCKEYGTDPIVDLGAYEFVPPYLTCP